MLEDSIPRSIIALIILNVLGGFFSGAETAFSYANRIRIKRKAEEGSKNAKRVLKILDSFDRLLTTILIGTNISHVLISSIATVVGVQLLGATSGPVVATVVMTLIVFFFSETLPKNFARVNADAYSLYSALPLRIIMVVCTPVTLIFSGFSAIVKRIVGTKKEPTMTEDEFAAVIEDVEEDGLLEPEESALIQHAIEFSDRTAAEVMVPIDQITGIEISATQEEIRQIVLSTQYSRLPLYRETKDDVLGVVRTKDLLWALLREEELNLAKYMTPPYFVPAETNLDLLFEGLGRRRRTHIAFVMGENGVSGFVTMEDILEELVGDIYAGSDDTTPLAVQKEEQV